MKNRAGETHMVPNMGYKAYYPKPLPKPEELYLDSNTNKLLNEVYFLLGKLDGYASSLPNIELFISTYVRKEALLSSQIEGTQVSLIDILDPNSKGSENLDVLDVVNYTKALSYGIERLKGYPLTGNFLKEIHKILILNTRGYDNQPGEFRHSQNWVGPAGCSLNTASYVPPTVEVMKECISDLERYINEEDMNPILKASLVHYQFETIHPFLDGNGRIGRMLIILILINEGVIKYPLLYISYYLKKHRVEYYDRLEDLRLTADYEKWIIFMLKAMKNSCMDALENIENIKKLKAKFDNDVKDLSNNIKRLYEYIWINPIIDTSKTSKDLNLSYNTISSAIKKLESLNILVKSSGDKRNKIYHFKSYLDILKKDTEVIDN